MPVAYMRAGIAAGVLGLSVALSSTSATAQSLIDFLWGGEEEWGGGRQTVSFNPQYKPGQIIVSFGDRRLYLLTRQGEALSYPIAVPREQSRWQGATAVTNKRENPDWTPTPEMMRENPRLPSWVPGGHPMNPLGVRALYLGSSTYRIHGTDAPWTIGQAVSKGCIRMFNEDVLDLYPKVPVGTKVIVTWERFRTETIAAADPTAPRPGKATAPPATPVATASAPATATSSSDPFASLFFSDANAANAPRPREGMASGSSRKIGGGNVSRAAQREAEELAEIEQVGDAAPVKTAARTPAKAEKSIAKAVEKDAAEKADKPSEKRPEKAEKSEKAEKKPSGDQTVAKPAAEKPAQQSPGNRPSSSGSAPIAPEKVSVAN